jgi:S1-C subfamily serine protease
MGLVDGKPVPVGGDIILAVQGITTASNEALDQVLKSLETMKPGDELRVTILRDEKVADLSMKIPGP